MRRVRWIASMAGLGLALLFSACGPGKKAAPPAAKTGPSTVVVVTIDTLRADRVGCYGYEDAGTRMMDTLAEEGARFEAAQTTAPLTLPAHASILTGRTLPAHGVFNNGTFALPAGLPTLAEALEKARYATGAFVSSPVLARRYGLARGFAAYDDDIPRPERHAGLVVHYDERSGQQTAQAALKWLSAQKGPALAWVHLWEPHIPYAPPAEFKGRFSDPYQGEVAAADAALSALVSGVRAQGRDGNLLIVVVSDHGEGLGDHGEPTHGVFLYRETMQVPMLIWGPAHGIQPAVIEGPVSVADIAPTILDLLGLPPLDGADGLSLAPALTGKGKLAARPGVFAESHLPRLEFNWSGLRAFVGKDDKFIEAPMAELYDLHDDPKETRNLAAQRARETEAARAALLGELNRAEASAPTEQAGHAVSGQELERLAALGYAATGRRTESGPLVDPKKTDPKTRPGVIEQHDRAIGMISSGRPEEAIGILMSLAQEDPRNPSVLFQLGQAQILARRFQPALATFSRLVSLDPKFGLAWYRLGALLDNAGDFAAAETAYHRSIEADPFALEPRKALASLQLQLGKSKEARATLEQILTLDPADQSAARQLSKLPLK